MEGDVDEEDEAALRPRIQDISSAMQPRRASRPSRSTGVQATRRPRLASWLASCIRAARRNPSCPHHRQPGCSPSGRIARSAARPWPRPRSPGPAAPAGSAWKRCSRCFIWDQRHQTELTLSALWPPAPRPLVLASFASASCQAFSRASAS